MVAFWIESRCVDVQHIAETFDACEEARLGRYPGRDKLNFEFEQKFVKRWGILVPHFLGICSSTTDYQR